MKRRNRFLIVFLISAVAFVVLVGLTLLKMPKQLLERSTFLLRTNNLNVNNLENYCWMTDESMLIWNEKVYLYNFKSQKCLEVAKLTPIYDGMSNITVSRDSRLLLWRYSRGSKGATFTISTLEGSHWNYDSAPMCEACFTHDSRHWLDVYLRDNDPVVTVHSVSSGESNVSIALPITVDGKSLTGMHFLGVCGVADDLVFEDDCVAKNHISRRANIYVIEAKKNRPTILRFSIQVATPPVVEPILSPDGKQLAWQLERDQTSPIIDWIRAILKLRGNRQQSKITEMWVSNLNGTKMHEVGYVASDSNQEGPGYFKWLPDNVHMSFIYRDSMYRFDTRNQ